MNIDAAFPSTYLKASDLQGRTAKVVMSHIKMEDVGGDHKPVLYFQGKDKGIVLNKTNSTNIASTYGTETDNWAGKELFLYTALVDFQGKTVEAIRVRTSAPPSFDQSLVNAPAQQPAPAPAYDNGFDEVTGDSIPF